LRSDAYLFIPARFSGMQFRRSQLFELTSCNSICRQSRISFEAPALPANVLTAPHALAQKIADGYLRGVVERRGGARRSESPRSR
jgi:hypothetical protein